jgi:c-di-GMP-binding flagellar brake protein YcgR
MILSKSCALTAGFFLPKLKIVLSRESYRMGKSDKSKTERRQFRRVMAPVFYTATKQISPKRRVSDLSLGGVRIYSDEWLDVGGRLELEFMLPDGSTVKAMAKVTWIKEMPEGEEAMYDVGMEFMELSATATEKLKTVLK